ncbi:MAG: T9SS type A sorting domain-containing protein [Bacteroidales bacterium]
MRIFLTLIYLLFFLYSSSQDNIVFNNNYKNDEGSGNWISSGMIIDGNDYVINGGYSVIMDNCSDVWTRGICFIEIDSLGDISNKKHFSFCNNTIYEGRNKSIIKNNNGYFATSYKICSDTAISSIILFKLDNNLDTINTYEYFKDTTSKRAWGITSTYDDGFVIVGSNDTTHSESNLTSTYVELLMFKINSNGDLIWHKKFDYQSSEDYSYNFGRNIIECNNDDLVISGRTRQSEDVRKNIILKTDSLGNEKWHNIYGAGYDTPLFMDIIETRDSSILVCGAYTYGETFGGLYPYDGWLLKLNPDGTTVWNRKYREHTVNNSDWRDTIYCEFVSITELDDGGLAAIARVRSTDCPCKDFKLYRMNSEGDTLWTKPFSSYPDGNILYYPNSISQTADGGFAISGYEDYYEWSDSSGWVSSQQIFLIKTDSLGNDSLSYISEPQASPISRYELEVYPNPASRQLHIKLPANFPGGDMQVINQQGQIVNTIHLPRHKQSPAELNVSSYPPGHYLLQIKARGYNYYGRFVKNQ